MAGSGFPEGIAAIDDQVFWASGSFGELRRYDLSTGEALLLGTFDHALTALAVNDEAVFYGSRSSSHPIIGRVDRVSGEATVLSSFDGSLNTGAGQLVLDDTHLYFSVSDGAEEGNGGVFRLGLVDGVQELVAATDFAPGVGVDDDTVYFTDDTNARVKALAKADIGAGASPTELALALYPGELFVGEQYLYYASSTGLDRISKDGGDFTRLLETTEVVFSIAGDEAHVYAVIPNENRIVRVERGTSEPEVVVLPEDGHTIALTCNSIVWTQGSALLLRPK